MKCPTCGAKMIVISSRSDKPHRSVRDRLRIPDRVPMRIRRYECPECGHRAKTAELEVSQIVAIL